MADAMGVMTINITEKMTVIAAVSLTRLGNASIPEVVLDNGAGRFKNVQYASLPGIIGKTKRRGKTEYSNSTTS